MMGRRRNGIRGLRYDLPDGRRRDGRYRLAALHRIPVDTAVNAGAQYAVNNAGMVSSGSSTLNTEISNLVNNLNGTGWATSTVNVSNSNDTTGCYCPSGTPGSWTWGSTVTCGNSCASGGGIGGQFVTITANRSISPIFTAFG